MPGYDDRLFAPVLNHLALILDGPQSKWDEKG